MVKTNSIRKIVIAKNKKAVKSPKKGRKATKDVIKTPKEAIKVQDIADLHANQIKMLMQALEAVSNMLSILEQRVRLLEDS